MLAFRASQRLAKLHQINRSALSFEDKAATKSNLCDRFIKWLQQPTEPCKGLPKKKTKRKATKKVRFHCAALVVRKLT